MPESNVQLVLKGTLWGTPVTVHLERTEAFQRGQLTVSLPERPLDVGKQAKEILGENFELKLPGALDIYFFNKENEGATAIKALGATYGALDFQYCWKGEGEYAFFVNIQLDDLLAKIPGLPEGAITGHVFAGYMIKEGLSHFVKDSDGVWQIKEAAKGFLCGGELTVAGRPLALPTLPDLKAMPLSLPDIDELTTPQDNKPNWVDMDGHKAGPIKLHSLGVSMQDGKVRVLVRADMTLSGLTLSLLGAGVEVELNKLIKTPLKAFHFKMLGLGLAYQRKGFAIAGFFEKLDMDKEEYAGGILFKTNHFAITGIGAYSDEEGYKSIFGYLSVDVNLGGPPSFYVLGLVACFGYNRQLLIPDIDQINEFPLVRYAIDSSTGPDFSQGNPLVEFNKKLAPFIPPKRDHLFFGIGVKFSTYRVVTTVALLTAAQGDDLEFNLLGISRLILPPGNNGAVLVFVELALRGSFSFEKGLLQVEGRLSNQSYIFSQSVKLTGGFAFYAWFKNQGTARAGEFVITVGGYHPRFGVPAHYPTVPRLGFEWKVGESLTLAGKMYLALTSRAIMAGGAFEALFKAGGLEAEFHFNADFLISWKPFAYDISLRVSMHISYHIDTWLVNRTVSLGLNVGLRIWGPDFSGKALLEFRVLGIGFSIPMRFGSGPKKPQKLKWNEFKKSFVSEELAQNGTQQEGQSRLLSVMSRGGLIGEMQKGQQSIWVISPEEFALAIESIIPVTAIAIKDDQVDAPKTLQDDYAIPLVEESKVKSTLSIGLEKPGVEGETYLQLVATPVNKNMPKAVWSDTVVVTEKDKLSADTTLPMTVGVELRPQERDRKNQLFTMNESAFRADAKAGKGDISEDQLPEASFDDFLIMDLNRYPKTGFATTPLLHVLDDSTESLTETHEL